MDKIILKRLQIDCIIGIFKRERIAKQRVWIDLEFPCDAARASLTDNVSHTVDYKTISKAVLKFVSASRFKLIETLAERVASLVLSHGPRTVTVTVWKPGAVRFSDNVGVSITRGAAGRHCGAGERAYISIGSNIGKEKNIPAAIDALRDAFSAAKFSAVYASTAVGGPPQPQFWNAVAEIRTTLSPVRLRAKMKELERGLGRKRTADKYAPRAIDLDVIFYGSRVDASLKLPHPDAVNAPYILLPLAELNPHFVHPTFNKTVVELLGAQISAHHLFKKVPI